MRSRAMTIRSAVLRGSGGAAGAGGGRTGFEISGVIPPTGRTPEARAGGATTGVSERGNEGEGARGTVERAVLTGPLQKGWGRSRVERRRSDRNLSVQPPRRA